VAEPAQDHRALVLWLRYQDVILVLLELAGEQIALCTQGSSGLQLLEEPPAPLAELQLLQATLSLSGHTQIAGARVQRKDGTLLTHELPELAQGLGMLESR